MGQSVEDRHLPAEDVRVAIIGAGVSGIATCKALTCRGIKCVLFEGQSRLGGLWLKTYPGARVQAPKHTYELADHRFSPAASRFPTAKEVVEYCEDYAGKWNLWPNIHLETDVLSVSRKTTEARTRFSVEWQKKDTGATISEDFTHVVLATGLCSNKPHMPKFPGSERFTGRLLHSSDRRDDALELAGKKVLVVGSGKSALDTCMAAVDAGAESVTQLVRTLHWAIPCDLFGCIPYDWTFHNRVVQKIAPTYPGARLRPVAATVRALTAPLRWTMWRSMEGMFLLHWRIPRRLWPRRSMSYDFTGESVNLISPGYMPAIRKGTIDVKIAEIKTLKSHGALLQLKSPEGMPTETLEVPADTIVLATGYELGMKPLSGELVKELKPTSDGLALYKHMMHPNVPGLFFAGGALSFMHSLTVSIQAAWLGELLLGNIAAPTAEEMGEAIVRQQEGHSRYPPSNLRSRLLNAHGDQFHSKLLKEMGVERLARFGGPFGPIANSVLPCEPKLCANAVQPKSARRDKALKPPALFKVLVIATLGFVGYCARERVESTVRELKKRPRREKRS